MSTLNKIIAKKKKKEKEHNTVVVSQPPIQPPPTAVPVMSAFKDSPEPRKTKVKPATSVPRRRRDAPSSTGPVYRLTTEVERPQILPINIKTMQLESAYDAKIPLPSRDSKTVKKPQSASGGRRRSNGKISSSLQTMGGNLLFLQGGDDRVPTWQSSVKSVRHVNETAGVPVSKETASQQSVLRGVTTAQQSVLRGVVTRRLSEPII